MACGKLHAMKLRMDKSGRVVLPKPLRRRLGVQNNAAELEVVEQPNGVLLRKVDQQPSMIRVDGLWVHQGIPDPDIDWDRVIDGTREERIRDIIGS